MTNRWTQGGAVNQVLLETNTSIPIVHFSASLFTGSLEDAVGKEGTVRLMMRLMRRTGGGRTAEQIEDELDKLGATLGAEVAGSTCGISGTVIARNLDPFLALVKDVISASSLEEGEFQRLKRETKDELVEVLDNDRALAQRWFRRTFFRGHPYGRPVAGTQATLDSITREDLVEARSRCWVQDNMIVGFAGDIDAETGVRAAQTLRESLPSGPRRADSTLEPAGVGGRHLVFVDKPERTQTQILIGTLGSSSVDDDHTALLVSNTVFGGTFTARLCQEVRAKRGWSYGAYSALPYDRKRHAFTMTTFPKAADAAACTRLELQLLEDWVKQGITAEELGWAQAYLVKSNAFAIDTAAKRVGLTLDEALYDLPANYFRDYEDRVRAVTLEQANAAIRRRINPDNLIIVVLGTNQDVGDEVKAAIDGLAEARVVPFDAS